MAWGTLLFVVMLHGELEDMADSLTQFISIFTDFRVDKFGIYLRGKNGIMTQNLLQGFKRHPFENGQNGKCVASDMRGDFDLTTAFLTDILEAAQHCLIFPHGENTVGRGFPFIQSSVLFNKFDGDGE